MELREVIEKRASVRQFADGEVCVEHLKEMVRLAGLAPSVNNSQPWRYIAITNRDLMKRLADAVREKICAILPDSDDESAQRSKKQVEWFSTFFADVPAVFAVLTHPYEAIIDKALPQSNLSHDEVNALRGYPDIESIGASIEHLLLAAVDLGYGGCWLSGPLVARDVIEKELSVQAPWRLEAMVAVGRPMANQQQHEKKPLEAIFELRA